MSLAFLYLFRSAAIAVYVLCGLCQLPYLDSELKLTAVTDNYVLSVCTEERDLEELTLDRRRGCAALFGLLEHTGELHITDYAAAHARTSRVEH